jgi:DNA-directed RNA polymerase specialized sigma24 family protein
MNERDWLAERFEEHRPHLRAVAYRMLGSLEEADEAVQDAWLAAPSSWRTTSFRAPALGKLRRNGVDDEGAPEGAARQDVDHHEESMHLSRETLKFDWNIGLT